MRRWAIALAVGLAVQPLASHSGEIKLYLDGAVGVATSPEAQHHYFEEWERLGTIATGSVGATIRNDFGSHFIGASIAARFGEQSSDQSFSWPSLTVREPLPDGVGLDNFRSQSFSHQPLGQFDVHYGVKAGDYNVVLGGGVSVDRYELSSVIDSRGSIFHIYQSNVRGMEAYGSDARSEVSIDSVRVSPLIFTSIERKFGERFLVSLRGQIAMQNGSISGSEIARWSADNYIQKGGEFQYAGTRPDATTLLNSVSAEIQPQGSLMLGLSFRLN